MHRGRLLATQSVVMRDAASFLSVVASQLCMTVHLSSRIIVERGGKPVVHDFASVQRLSLPRVRSPPRLAHSEASSSTRAVQRAAVYPHQKRSLQSTLHAFL